LWELSWNIFWRKIDKNRWPEREKDKFQGKRLGTKFVEVLIEIARERGLEEVRADVLTENEHMLKVFGRLGFSTQWFVGGTSEAVLKLKEQGAPGE